jgi:hypothetical protein
MEDCMIKFQPLDSKKTVLMSDEEVLTILEMVSSTVTNKFYLVTEFIEDVSDKVPEFNEWFTNFIKEYIASNNNYEVVEKNVDNIKKYIVDYLKVKQIDFSKFADETKAKKSSILLNSEEIEEIIRLSCYLKIYAVISNSENLKLDRNLHKKIYNMFADEVLKSETIFKIFNVVKTKTFRYNMTDKYMWNYIKMVQCKSIDVHVIEIFNFIMNSILILCEPDRNPVFYFIGVIDESIKWFLGSIYKGSIIYDDSISTEDIQSTNIDNLKTYSYNDTLGRLKAIAYEKIKDYIVKPNLLKFDSNDLKLEDEYVDIQKRVERVKYISPLCEYFIFPILSRVTGIPYNHFKTLSAEHTILLSVYMQKIFKKVFKNEYKNIISLLNYYPTEQPSIISTYKLKNMESFVNKANKVKDFFGIDTKYLLGNMLGTFIGRISRIKFTNILDGRELVGIPLSKVENEMIDFYILLFSNSLDNEMTKIKELVHEDF